jgi:uncharacterized protein YndB with AHSA1/START domain
MCNRWLHVVTVLQPPGGRQERQKMVPDRVERETLIHAPIEIVWAVITDPAHVMGWFGETAEIDLRPGGRITHAWKEEGGLTEERGIVERVEPPHYFSYRWIRGAEAEAREDNSTLVEFTLAADGEATRLRVVETGFSKLDWSEDERREDAESHHEGWEHELGELREYVLNLEGGAARR